MQAFYDSRKRLTRVWIKRLHTIKYYEENLDFFQRLVPCVENVDEITQNVVDDYASMLMKKGDRITAINARLRALFVFLRFSFSKGWAERYLLSQLKEDEYAKEPYSEEDLKKLLERPTSGNWSEWRSWAVINLLIATGIRVSTIVNIKISDVDFEHGILYLRKLKNRKQQTLPIPSSLEDALSHYLQLWEWNPDDFLFAGIHKEQLKPHSLESSIRRYNLSRGVSKTSVHLFRHTFAKNYVLAGGGMMQLQAILVVCNI